MVSLDPVVIRRIGSLSARRAWIEMVAACPFSCCGAVALRKESVDRNIRVDKTQSPASVVALRKESVDRNLGKFGNAKRYKAVALRKESVDRNQLC